MSLHAYAFGKSNCADEQVTGSENNQGAQNNQLHASSRTHQDDFSLMPSSQYLVTRTWARPDVVSWPALAHM
eukprot:3542698-Pyramimonas_sp.AAC.1